MSRLALLPSNREMWRAYAIAPAVTPVVFIAFVLAAGGSVPAGLMAMAFVACYLVAGVIGMPIAFALRRRNRLNAWSIHGAALAWGALWSAFCTVWTISVVVAIGGTIHSVPLTAAWSFALMAPPVVLAGTAFWLLLKNPKLATK